MGLVVVLYYIEKGKQEIPESKSSNVLEKAAYKLLDPRKA